MKRTHPTRRLLAALAATLAPAAADAVPLLTGLGGADGYGTPDHCVAMGNDNSYAAADATEPTAIDLRPASLAFSFSGVPVDHFYLNTNGNITFAAPLAAPSATAFPVMGQPMIAPWWADVDTRAGGSVCFHLEPGLLVATWHDVGSFDGHADRRDDFQLALSARPLCQQRGELALEFRYNRCEWTSGDGAMVPAQVGFDAGDLTHYVALPQSRSAAIGDVCRSSNVPGGPPGFYRFILVRPGPACPAGAPCTVAGQMGRCAQGVTDCVDDVPSCRAVHTPAPAVCTGQEEDYDCDGLLDDGDAACASGEVCDRDGCLPRCGPARACPAGTACTPRGGCIEAACLDVTCPQGAHCAAGRCVRADLCVGYSCPATQVCDPDPTSPTAGQCVERCECLPCADGRVCGADGRCALPAPVDAGVPDAGVPDAGVPPRGSLVDAGCGCRTGAPTRAPSPWLVALALATCARRRRR